MIGVLATAPADSPPPPHHLTDWSGWGWFFGVGGTLIFVGGSVVLMGLFVSLASDYPYGSRFRSDDSAVPMVLAGAAALVSAVIGTFLFWYVARHFADSSILWWLPAIAALVGLIIVSFGATGGAKVYGFMVTGAVFVGAVVGVLNDALSRWAASIPMALGTLITLVVLGVAGAIGYGVSQSSTTRR